FSWRFVEAPFRNKQTLTRNKIFLFSIVCIVIFSSIGFSMHLKNGYAGRVSFTEELRSTFVRPLKENCFAMPYNHSAEQWGCILGRDEGDISFILFGDSHSLSLKTIIDEKAKQKGVKVFYTGSNGCIPLIGIHPQRNDQHVNNCNLLNERVFQLAKDINLKGIILAARWSYYTLGDYSLSGAQLISDKAIGPFNLQHSIDTFSNAFDITVKKFSSIEVPIHIITQSPHQKYSPDSVYFSVAKGIGSVESMAVKRSDFEKLNQIPTNIFLRHDRDINIHDITDLFCDESLCALGEQGRSFYYDDNHLSTYGALRLEKTIEKIFERSSP
ncbi:MAG: SGNH hydrolase domain-containing protein, partial [Gammaproteobacteria bacterium]